MSDIKLGVDCWNQYTDWPALLEAGRPTDELGYDSLWTWDKRADSRSGRLTLLIAR